MTHGQRKVLLISWLREGRTRTVRLPVATPFVVHRFGEPLLDAKPIYEYEEYERHMWHAPDGSTYVIAVDVREPNEIVVGIEL